MRGKYFTYIKEFFGGLVPVCQKFQIKRDILSSYSKNAYKNKQLLSLAIFGDS